MSIGTVESNVHRVVHKQAELDERLREIFIKHFEINSETSKDNPGYKAYATYAVEVAVALANIIIAVKNPEAGRGFRAISDLTYTLNANEFWLKNAPVLVPVLTIILNAHKDYVSMVYERSKMEQYAGDDKLIGSAQIVPLEIFSMMLYLVGGPMLMSVASLALKKDLLPYIV